MNLLKRLYPNTLANRGATGPAPETLETKLPPPGIHKHESKRHQKADTDVQPENGRGNPGQLK